MKSNSLALALITGHGLLPHILTSDTHVIQTLPVTGLENSARRLLDHDNIIPQIEYMSRRTGSYRIIFTLSIDKTFVD